MPKAAPEASVEDLRRRVAELSGHFYSPFDFGNGIVTRPPRVYRRFRRRLRLLQIPQDLTGKTVLDIGAWDGFFSFEFERRGAKRVLAIDSGAWRQGTNEWPRGLDCFLLAREIFKSKVEYQLLDAHDIDKDSLGTFDLVFAAGVLYHMRHPLLALEKIRSVTSGQLILETHQLIPAVHERSPLITFFPGDAAARDFGIPGAFATPSWIANAVTAAGFARHRFVYTPSFRWLKKFSALVTNRPQRGRIVVHAFPN